MRISVRPRRRLRRPAVMRSSYRAAGRGCLWALLHPGHRRESTSRRWKALPCDELCDVVQRVDAYLRIQSHANAMFPYVVVERLVGSNGKPCVRGEKRWSKTFEKLLRAIHRKSKLCALLPNRFKRMICSTEPCDCAPAHVGGECALTEYAIASVLPGHIAAGILDFVALILVFLVPPAIQGATISGATWGHRFPDIYDLDTQIVGLALLVWHRYDGSTRDLQECPTHEMQF